MSGKMGDRSRDERRHCWLCKKEIWDHRWVIGDDGLRVHADCQAKTGLERPMGSYYAVRRPGLETK